jgi:hypothetical protein
VLFSEYFGWRKFAKSLGWFALPSDLSLTFMERSQNGVQVGQTGSIFEINGISGILRKARILRPEIEYLLVRRHLGALPNLRLPPPGPLPGNNRAAGLGTRKQGHLPDKLP